MNTEEFIMRAQEVHGYKYNYNLVEYINMKTKVKIICPIHGIFEQIPDNHIRKSYGCSKCSSTTLTTEEFIKRAKEIHGNKYNYNLVEYINLKNKIKIICSTHGVFEQLPKHHLRGCGCKKCYKETRILTTEEFIKRAENIHCNKYDYKLVEYIDNKTKVKIICPIHGIFEQIPSQHFRKEQGCPKCNSSHGENIIRKFLTINNISYEEQKVFKECTYKTYLPFDFFIPQKNILIEFQGEQHYKPIKAWGGDKKLKIIQQRDKIKKEFCKKNNINLLEIHYKDINKIDEIMKEAIYIGPYSN